MVVAIDADAERDHDGRRGELTKRTFPPHETTTSSSRRDRPRKQDIAPISTQNGRIRSPICGTRKQRNLCDQQRGYLWIVAEPPHLLDVVEQDDQCEDAQQHGNQRGEETHAEVFLQVLIIAPAPRPDRCGARTIGRWC